MSLFDGRVEALSTPEAWCLQSPHAEETTDSYSGNLSLGAGLTSSGALGRFLFGTPSYDPCNPLHGGFGHFQKVMSRFGLGEESTIETRSLAALYRPFLAPRRYELLRSALDGIAVSAHSLVLGRGTSPFKVDRSHCPECLRRDIASWGYAPAYRYHQVEGVRTCLDHDVALVSACSICCRPFPRATGTTRYCLMCGADLALSLKTVAPALNPAWRRYAELCASVFRQEVPSAIDQRWYRVTIQDRVPSRCGALGANLGRLLLNEYGSAGLLALRRSPQHAPTLSWPMLFLAGYDACDPVACMLILAVLADSREWASLPQCPQSAWLFDRIEPNRDIASELTPAAVRQIYRGLSLREIAASLNVPENRVKRWVRAHPDAWKRVRDFRIRSAKRKLESEVRRNPKASKTALFRKYRAATQTVCAADPAFLGTLLSPSAVSVPQQMGFSL